MTQAEAQAEAVRRWGGMGHAWEVGGDKPFVVTQFEILHEQGIGYRMITGRKRFGRGLTWESAFEDADARQQKENPTQGGGNSR